MKAYHLTSSDSLQSIKKHGVISGGMGKPDSSPVGVGVYVFFDKRYADDMADYLVIEDPILITVDVNANQLLMDEDALYFPDEGRRLMDVLCKAMPKQAANEYIKFIKQNGGDDVPINDPEIAEFKINLIDRYQIRPYKDFKVGYGHYSILTARCMHAPLKPLNVEHMSSDE